MRRHLLLLGTACLGLLCLFFVDQMQRRYHEQQAAQFLENESIRVRDNLESAFRNRFSAVESLVALFQIHPRTTPEKFATFAQSLLSITPPIRALQYADRDTRVTYVYPPKDNEIVIRDPMVLLTDPLRGAWTRRAIDARAATVQDPFPLRQGGTGTVVRAPIHVGNE